ncbi:VOC family protein [Phenylobacterium sp.]|jgi:predicted enzyme related to lactoylglutathione lyase|uniref:VOC family protein n=1 Tax=Phenylobacterium sp. TaxID=1871053 RepID=UPI002E37712A|nr:VOC family protein [Phenylobacterium sp.]HEX2558763.1 VOC family protein [Phenylobacterium sp.]
MSYRHIKFAHLPVADQERALAFWRDRLGLEVALDQSYGGGWRWIELSIPGAQTRLLFTERAADAPKSEQPSLILVVDDVDAEAAALKARGVAFVEEPRAAPWSPGERYAMFEDSEGNRVLISSG